jgi:hypothetical protein
MRCGMPAFSPAVELAIEIAPSKRTERMNKKTSGAGFSPRTATARYDAARPSEPNSTAVLT